MIKVFHYNENGETPVFVAVVDSMDLNEALELTIHTEEKQWFENDKVIVIKKSRSTTTGDILELETVSYVVVPNGFVRLLPT